ncbi:hypothetical protein ACUR5C_14635 [Aliikangiella sp. IMCC44653]
MSSEQINNTGAIEAELKALQQNYSLQSSESPPTALDKQIIAAAHREAARTLKPKQIKISWWRRVSLPISALATVMFTVVATNLLWNEPPRVLPGTSPATKIIPVDTQKPFKYEVSEMNPELKALPTKPIIMAPPSSAANLGIRPTEATVGIVEYHQGDESQKSSVQALSSNSSATPSLSQEAGSHSVLSEEERRAREIIDLYLKGEFAAADHALQEFKQAYPQYPIDEQLDLLRQ